MSDLTQQRALVPAHDVTPFRLSPLAPWACVFAAGATGVLAGRAMGGDAAAYESHLLLLLRFMAAMKLGGVLLAAGLLHWRLIRPIAPRLAAAYAGSLVAMAAATGLIWSLGSIVLGAILFHAGLIAYLVLAWRDDAVRLSGTP